MSGRGRLGCLLLATLVAAGAPARSETPPSFEYVRDRGSQESVVRYVLGRTAPDEALLFVFDKITFDPPHGDDEFTARHTFADDIPAWGDALATAHAAGRRVFAAASTSKDAIEVGTTDWLPAWRQELIACWWTDERFDEFAPAHRWCARLLCALPAKKRTLVLVTGDVLPERWIRQPDPPGRSRDRDPETWRSRLCSLGDYWDEERVGSAVAAAGASLVVVAPEARFGDFLPLEDLPQAPWASRPCAPPALPKLGSLGGMDGGPGSIVGPAVEFESSGRFDSTTPSFFPRCGQQVPFNTHLPSGYGHWPFARAAAKSGGAYVLYPFPPGRWLDVCPRDASLVDAEAPDLVPRSEFARGFAADPALHAMLDAQALVLDVTPWTDFSKGSGQGGASTWWGLERETPRPDARWRPREKPVDHFRDGHTAKVEAWKEEGAKLVPVAAAYDRALEVLSAALARLEKAKWAGVPRRSQANLRLCRFWFEMSAFHLEALSIYLRELDRFMPPKSGGLDVTIAYVPAIRMSDCLDAYDGAVLTASDERRLAVPTDPVDRLLGEQGNLLRRAQDDRLFRARRDVDAVLLNLDPRLLPRALRMIDAARDVMAHDGRSAWGWVVYYSDACTFAWRPWIGGKARLEDFLPPSGDPQGPTTPPSGGGGPSTK